MSMIGYVQISADIGERVIEYADLLHAHFEDPCRIRNGAQGLAEKQSQLARRWVQ